MVQKNNRGSSPPQMRRGMNPDIFVGRKGRLIDFS